MFARPTALERARRLPGDGIVADVAGAVMHAVTIAAPPRVIWPWLVQMGAGRAGWYSYDWVDNGGVPSATTIIAEHQHLLVGDIMPSIPNATSSFVVSAIDPLRSLVLTVRSDQGSALVSWEFFLDAMGASDQTRLLARGRISSQWPGKGDGRPRYPIEWVYWVLARIPVWLMMPAARFGHAVMQIRQLNGIKRRAESQFAIPQPVVGELST